MSYRNQLIGLHWAAFWKGQLFGILNHITITVRNRAGNHVTITVNHCYIPSYNYISYIFMTQFWM